MAFFHLGDPENAAGLQLADRLSGRAVAGFMHMPAFMLTSARKTAESPQ